jgi:hypothetical protein
MWGWLTDPRVLCGLATRVRQRGKRSVGVDGITIDCAVCHLYPPLQRLEPDT